jgi:chromosomal replication initiation ATPase DnaA
MMVSDIIAAVASETGVAIKDIRSSRQDQKSSRARHLAMYAARHLTERSYPQIGCAFGKDHTTIMRAVRIVTALYTADHLNGLLTRISCHAALSASLRLSDVRVGALYRQFTFPQIGGAA